MIKKSNNACLLAFFLDSTGSLNRNSKCDNSCDVKIHIKFIFYYSFEPWLCRAGAATVLESFFKTYVPGTDEAIFLAPRR